MQQTQTYKLNLLETSDAFSPSPLNENMEKVEGALLTKTDAAALEARLAPLEAHKIVVGNYRGGGKIAIDLGCTPKLVILHKRGDTQITGFICESDTGLGSLTSTGFEVNGGGGSTSVNDIYVSYMYAAFI